MFKQLKQLRETTAALPGVMADANALRIAAQSYQTAAVRETQAALLADDPRLTPIAGVDLATYARISKTSAGTGRKASEIAPQLGITEDSWLQAAAGWPTRMSGDTSLAVYYGQLYARVA